ncbi:nicotinamide mononucleotide transporter [Streptosporangium becharense]|uniref:Nicotinamide mononucleotide transporter n=1 Tax=Streptosporangium becharense TaxID=1816182 RepID=A0A7W9ICW4_9ACTN|nr:nicotinamide mononucleotide transporter family protein [Streptosporangium becharense]MBB2912833.1 nicotinamide mononucleotide transporter [Streptosporangium becharense]MBB5818342.1 nicotinamide mononucleotide transporter [Streptosporangium becharense]
MNWAEAGFEVLGTRVLWTDLVGNLAALSTVLLAIRKSIWTWPVQFTGAILLFVASISAQITGNALKQAMFAGLAVYGWWRWSRGTRDGQDLAVRPATGPERLALTGVMVAGTALVGVLFYVTGLSWGASVPAPEGYLLVAADAYIFVGSAVATWAQGRALVDFWLIWVAVDLVGVPLAFSSGLVVSGAVYGVFFVLVLIGFFNWLKEYRSTTVLTPKEAV